MKKVLCVILSITALMCGCGKKKQEPADVPELSASSMNMIMGEEQKLTVTNYDGDIIWETSNLTVASVSETGDVKALAEGSAVITAQVDAAEKMSCVVTVTVGTSAVQSITVTSYYSSSSDITINYQSEPSTLLRASCMPQAAGEKLLWASENENVATVSQDGTVTAKANGVTAISVTALNGVSGKCTIRVKNAPTNADAAPVGQTASENAEAPSDAEDDPLNLPVSSPMAQSKLVISDTELYMNVADDKQLEVTLSNAPEGTYVDWSSSKPSVAVVKFGKVVAVGNGITIISAYTQDGAAAGCYVAVGKQAKKELKKMLENR